MFLRGYNRGTTTGFNPVLLPSGLKPELQLHSPPNQGILSSVACAWFGLLPKGCQSRVGSQCRTLTSHVRHRAPRVAYRIALCTRPPTTHSRGASGRTSWIRPTCKRTIDLSPQFSRQGAGRVSARASARAPSNATDQRSEIVDSHHGRAATSSSTLRKVDALYRKGGSLSKPLTGLSGGCIQPGVRYSSVRKTACDAVWSL